MSWHGDIALGSTLDIKFTTYNPATGAPATLSGTPAVAAYPDNSLTELTAGITLTVDFDALTGLNNVRVVATGGDGYAAGSNYVLVITTGTVGGVSAVGSKVGAFSIEARSALRPTVAGRTVGVEVDGHAHADVKEWLGVAPSALIAGRVDANAQVVGDKTGYAIGTGGIAAAAFAANAVDSAALAASAAQEVADETLNRDIAGGASGGARTIRSALRKLRNRLAIAAGVLTVYQEDDLTPDHTEAVTTMAGNPITETDPAT